MKTLHLLILVAATMVFLVAFGTYVIVHPIFGGIAPSSTIKGYIRIDTPGLEKIYKTGQPINFSVSIRGFGLYPCKPPEIAIYNDAQTKPVFYYTTQSVTCPDSSEHYIFYFPSQNDTFSTVINTAGNYTVKVSIGPDSYQKEFFVIPDEKMIINENGGRPLNLTMHVTEIDVGPQTTVTPNFPLVLKRGDDATLKIKIISQVPEPMSLQLRIFNNADNYEDLAFARVKFNGDISGLPNGLIASFGKDVIAINANGSNQETLTFTVGQNVKAGSYQIGVLGLATISSPAGTEMGNSQILWIPITIK